jgi:hypothetical protein
MAGYYDNLNLTKKKNAQPAPTDYFADDEQIGFSYDPAEIARQERDGLKRAAIVGGIGALGNAAQVGLTLIDSAQDVENKKRLAELDKHKGLSEAERAEIDEQAMRGVRALANEAQTRNNDALAASGRTSAKDLQRARRANTDAVNRASIAAADIGIREQRAQVARDTQEEQERIAYEGQRVKDRISLVGQSIGGVMQALAAPIAAQSVKDEPSDAQLLALGTAKRADGRLLYPSYEGLSAEQARNRWRADYAAAMANRG